MTNTLADSIRPAELWFVEPPEPSPAFTHAVGYMLYHGADLAIGESDALPTEPPDTPDGIKIIVVEWDDIERVKHKLNGFAGFRPDQSPPFSGDTFQEKYRGASGLTFVHENRRLWLAVMGPQVLHTQRSLDKVCMVMAGARGNNQPHRRKMLARPDERLQRELADGVVRARRVDWGDIPFQHGKALLDTYELTGDRRYYDEVIDRAEEMLANVPEYPSSHSQMPTPIFVRLHGMTGDERYLAPVRPLVDAVLDGPDFRRGECGFLQTQDFMVPETYAVMARERAGAGTYGCLMVTHYMPAMLTARPLGREAEMADLVAMCVKEQRRHLLDPQTGLYFQSIMGHQQVPRGNPGHGTAWTLYALELILEVFPTDHPERADLVEILRELAEATARVQTDEGAFRTLLDIDVMPVSTLYTSMIGCAFLRAARMGYLSDHFRIHGLRTWPVLKHKVFRGAQIGEGAGMPPMSEYASYFHRQTRMNLDYTGGGGSFWTLHVVNEVLRLPPEKRIIDQP